MNAHDFKIKTPNYKADDGHGHSQSADSNGAYDRHISQQALNRKKFQAAEKYSKRVRQMKKSLPILGGLFIIIFVAVVISRQILTTPLGIATIDLTNGQVVMDRPSLSGFTASNSEYDIVAEKALQDLDDPKKVVLEKIAATLTLDDGNVISVEANEGHFNVEGEKLRLGNGISIHTSAGYKGTFEQANIDIKSGVLSSNAPVKLQSEIGDIEADSLIVKDNGAYILFEDRVRMIIVPEKIRPQTTQ